MVAWIDEHTVKNASHFYNQRSKRASGENTAEHNTNRPGCRKKKGPGVKPKTKLVMLNAIIEKAGILFINTPFSASVAVESLVI